MSIRFWDSMKRASADLTTREPGRVSMYLCGPTVYNRIHIGNARTMLWLDMIRRYLIYRGYQLTFVMNYTDVDDKTIKAAQDEGLPLEGVTNKYAQAFEDDMRRLGVWPPDVLCRATDHVPLMVEAIQGLINAGYAYDAEGDVFFSVQKFGDYGKLSGQSIEAMREGARVEPHASKRHPLDFSLWKSAKEGEPSWPSPWGPGRPGWHIECSVMSSKYLGMGFDIHGGGTDLIFPHHENEIAQAESLDPSSSFARHWLHAGMVQVGSEKMAKSLGNFVFASDVIDAFGGEVARYWALSGTYRSQVAFSKAGLEDARAGYERWRNFWISARHALEEDTPATPDIHRPLASDDQVGDQFVSRFLEAMDDDFNSPEAFAAVHDLVREANKLVEGAQRGDETDRKSLQNMVEPFLELTAVLGFKFEDPETPSELTGRLVEYLLELRDQARLEKAFDRADEIRTKLGELGITIEDTPAGARWRVDDSQA
jgi:cysteinyl-tRNA synthetase